MREMKYVMPMAVMGDLEGDNFDLEADHDEVMLVHAALL